MIGPFECSPHSLVRAGTSPWPGLPHALALASCLMMAGCAHLRSTTASPTSPAAAESPAKPSAASSTPGAPAGYGAPAVTSSGTTAASTASPPAFDSVIKGAERQDGLLPLWKRQDKVWVELSPQDFGRAYFLSPKLATGVGEGGFFGGLLASRWAQVGRPQWVEFRKVNQQVQLVAVNASFRAAPDTPQAQAVQAAFSPSLLASVAVASAAHPQRGTVLVELSSLLTGDVLGLGQQLQRAFRQSYSLDARNTAIIQTRSSATGLVLQVQQHFATGTIAAPSATPGPQPSVPDTLPDPRSLFITVQYTLSPLPVQAMAARPADARVGFFTTTIADFSDDLARSPRQRFINRWRLEKKDPAAPISPPVRPLVYWLDPSIPKDYRDAIRQGILEWNKAFLKIGIQGAIEVRDDGPQQPLDIVGSGQAIIRWMTNNQPTFGAIGPTHVDPRSGEILTADIALESLSSRAIRAARAQILQTAPADPLALPGQGVGSLHPEDRCEQADIAAEQLAYGLDVLAARGDLPPDSAEVKAFVLAYLKDTTMHEVGHTLGLRHNFNASRWHTQAELQQPELTAREGNSASVMDYAPINLGMPGQTWGAPFQTTLGPYDYWAIEYGYKAIAGDAPAQLTALRAIAQRQAEPAWQTALDYGTDEDLMIGLDPHSLTFDLGRDPIEFARHRLAMAKDLITRQSTVRLNNLDEAPLLRRRISYALRDIARTSGVLARQVGALITRRDAPGSGRALLDPLPAVQQREALDLLVNEFLSPDALRLPAALQRQLAPDYFERGEGMLDASGTPIQTDFSLAEQLSRLQRDVLNILMNDGLAERVLDNIDKTRDREDQPLTVRELHRRLREAIWPAKASVSDRHLDDNATWRRNLQREYVNRLSIGVLRGSVRADVRSQLRQQARLLVEQLQGQRGGDPNSTEQAHRRDCLETLQRALSATVLRSTP
jgi:hypothetical protein